MSACNHFLFKNIHFATPWTLPPRPPSYLHAATLLVTTVSNLDDESYKSAVSWFNQVFVFAPPALIVLHNAAVIHLRCQVVLFVTLAGADVRFGIGQLHTRRRPDVDTCGWFGAERCCLMCVGVTGENMAFVNSCYMSSSPAKVCLFFFF